MNANSIQAPIESNPPDHRDKWVGLLVARLAQNCRSQLASSHEVVRDFVASSAVFGRRTAKSQRQRLPTQVPMIDVLDLTGMPAIIGG